MSKEFTALVFFLFMALCLYGWVAAALCTSRNRPEEFHWWCPLCHFCRVLGRRMW